METTPNTKLSERGFTLIETLISLVLLSGAFVALAGAVPLAAVIHRGALERELALSLAQSQMEYFLSNHPGPAPGDSGTQASFMNASLFPPGYKGSYAAYSFAAGSGLTLLVVGVTPPHVATVTLSAIQTTYSNALP